MSAATLEAEVEAAAIDLFADLGWQTANVYDEVLGAEGTLGRETRGDVVLARRLSAAIAKLNPGIADHVVTEVVDALARDRSAMSLAQANRETYRLLREGVKVRVAGVADDGEEGDVTVRVIDWDAPENNDFFVAQQLWIQGDVYLRRADLVDLLRGALPGLSAKDAGTVKGVAEKLPTKLAKKLVIDWRKSQRGRAAVRAAIEDALEALPEAYGPPEYQAAVAAVYEHVFESYWGDGKSKYTEAAPA